MENQQNKLFNSTPNIFNINKLVGRAIDYWYLYLISLIICVFIAWFKVHYATPMYKVYAQVLVHDDNKSNNPLAGNSENGIDLSSLFGDKTNIQNEIGILQTTDLCRQVVDKMKLYINCYHKGSVRQVELYNGSPFWVEYTPDNGIIHPVSMELNFPSHNSNDFVITVGEKQISWHFDVPLHYKNGTFIFKNRGQDFEANTSYILTIQDPQKVATDLANNKGTSAAQNYIVTKYNLKGFDAANNPLYDNGIVIGSTGVISFNDVQPIPFLYSRCQGIITKSGKIIMYGAYPIVVNNQPVQSGYNQGYHLGAIKLGATGFTWQTRKATYTNYQGDYPTDGSFDVGNGVRYNAGSGVIVLDSILFTQEHNEFWKQTQTNIWNVYSEKGLFIGQFGIAKPRNEVLSPNTVAPYGMSGNGFALSGVKLGNDYYLYNNDESFHGGLHRWKVNISTSTQTIPVTLNRVQKGLCAYYFKDSDLNIANYIASQIDTLLEFKGKGSIPVNGFNSDKYSVRWQGFLQAKFSEPYTLGVRTSGNVRLYFDDTLRIGDTAVTLRDVFFKTPVLQAGKLYSIKAEFANNPSVNAYAQLYWQSASQNRQAIPFHYLTPNSDSVLYSEPSKGIDLLADLPFNTEMTAGYGWTRTGTASNLWTAITNRYNYKKPDLYLSYSLGSNVELRKDLGISEDVNAWNLSLTIDMFRSGYSNSPGTGKLALEIMDSSNKRLARIEPITTQSSGTTYQEVKTNETNVFSMPYNLIDKTTNIVLAYSSGNFTIQVNNSTIYKLNSLDAGGNIAFPKYLRFVGLNATGEKDIAPKAFYLSKAIFQYQNYHLTLRKH